jgi:hypothetical protein
LSSPEGCAEETFTSPSYRAPYAVNKWSRPCPSIITWLDQPAFSFTSDRMQVMGNEKGPRHLPVEGRGNVEVRRAAGPLPFQPPGEASAAVKPLYFLKCCVDGCDWSTWSTDKRSGLEHRRRSQHSHLQSHLFEPIPPEELKEKRQAANRQRQRDYQARKRAAKEVGTFHHLYIT